MHTKRPDETWHQGIKTRLLSQHPERGYICVNNEQHRPQASMPPAGKNSSIPRNKMPHCTNTASILQPSLKSLPITTRNIDPVFCQICGATTSPRCQHVLQQRCQPFYDPLCLDIHATTRSQKHSSENHPCFLPQVFT